MSGRKTSTTIYMEPEQHEALRALSERTGVPIAVYVRQGIAAALRANASTVSRHDDMASVDLSEQQAEEAAALTALRRIAPVHLLKYADDFEQQAAGHPEAKGRLALAIARVLRVVAKSEVAP